MGSSKKLDPNQAAARKGEKEKKKQDKIDKIRKVSNMAKNASNNARKNKMRKAARRRSVYGYGGLFGTSANTDEAVVRTRRLLI